MMIRFLMLSCVLCLSAMAIGCGENKVPLHGRVVFAEDKAPLSGGMVFFETDTYRARGGIDSNGNYTVSSTGQDDGIPPGTYHVYVKENLQMGETAKIDPKYTSRARSEITLTVDASTKQFDFEIERIKDTKRR
jgi:hypothetical protein